MRRPSQKRRFVVGLAAFFFSIFSILLLAGLFLAWPGSPVPDAWNPFRPFRLSDEVTPFTGWKLDRAANDLPSCLAALEGQGVERMEDWEFNENCHIRNRVKIRTIGNASLAPVETRCTIALRMAGWEKHSIQPSAEQILGSRVKKIDHFSSYSCREIRTPEGSFGQMSKHATADAIDIAGFHLDDGRHVTLLEGWQGSLEEQAFLESVRDGACDWFKTTLGPDYNEFHADHFHLQSRGWGTCR